MRIQIGGTHITNTITISDSDHVAVNLPSTSPPPQRPPTSPNWAVLAVQVTIAIAGAAKALAPLLGLVGG
ncbi:hypothetical protein EIELFIGP_00729 [Stenotrophomonas maltophilia]|uniref:hypothetical protein n=1 Tax=Stenotrophomonas maltophilia TaxID=40324 RepID=UPI000C15BFA2|nr:hypothetical protein [Stenotrophomonas maltophilia]MCU1041154.1 hypothetical protein [Stenotrophomonas maltophilia]QGM08015.1 hypothetical protein FEO84_01150 [Stenotrophomonas maltophilia]QNG71940.1 hypothetical protein EIELFIGP_00729 [Stenotrophomonas maltophilia]RRU78836.1 hypothetical protein EGJ24_14740 [Stenotrophomonas maltophilia]HDS1829474.1 hypothetical protein [Stenotrophomonas maltophilia]